MGDVFEINLFQVLVPRHLLSNAVAERLDEPGDVEYEPSSVERESKRRVGALYLPLLPRLVRPRVTDVRPAPLRRRY